MKKFKLKRRRGLGNTAESYAYLYYGLFALCSLLFVVIAMITNGDTIGYSLYYKPDGIFESLNNDYTKTTDLFMDFFNSVRDASSENGGYVDRHVIYPPLANLLYLAIGKIFKGNLLDTAFGDRFLLRNNDPVALLVFFVSIMLCVFSVYLIIDRYLLRCGFKAAPAALAITSALSFPMLYAIQRGNIIILAIPLTMFFVFFRNHERKLVRELSYIALAIAAGLKLYPAVFGVLLITDKKYKEAVRLVIYGILAFVLPVFAFGGPEMLWQIIQNVFGFNSGSSEKAARFRSGYSYQELVAVFLHNKSMAIFGKIVFWCLELMAAIMVFVLPKDWQKLTALCYMVFNIRSLSSIYALTFFLIPFVMFLTDKRKFKWNDYLYLLCLSLMFIPLPCIWYGFTGSMAEHSGILAGLTGRELVSTRLGLIAHYTAVNRLVSVIAFQGVFILLTLDVLLTPGGDKKKARSSSADSDEKTAVKKETASEITEESV